jgi:hypothetical protein
MTNALVLVPVPPESTAGEPLAVFQPTSLPVLINGVAGGHGGALPIDRERPTLGDPQAGWRGQAEPHDRIGGGGQPHRHPQPPPEGNPAGELAEPRTGLKGSNRLERVKWRNNLTGDEETKSIAHVFVMTGAEPNTGWLSRCVVLDGKGFIKTWPELSQEELIEARWPLARRPYLLETSLPQSFCCG